MRLENISNIFIGVLKSRFQNEGVYEYLGIDCSSLENGEVNCKKTIKLCSDKQIDEKFFIKNGDIIVKLYPPISFYEVKELNESLLPLSNVAIIRKFNDSIDNEQLIFILKRKKAEIEKIANGSHLNIKVLRVSDLNKLEISAFINDPLLKQKAKLDSLFEKYKALLAKKIELINLKQKYILGEKYE